MKIERLDSGSVILLDNDGGILKGLSAELDISIHPYKDNFILLSESIKMDACDSINIDATDLYLIKDGIEEQFTGTRGELIRELYENYL